MAADLKHALSLVSYNTFEYIFRYDIGPRKFEGIKTTQNFKNLINHHALLICHFLLIFVKELDLNVVAFAAFAAFVEVGEGQKALDHEAPREVTEVALTAYAVLACQVVMIVEFDVAWGGLKRI